MDADRYGVSSEEMRDCQFHRHMIMRDKNNAQLSYAFIEHGGVSSLSTLLIHSSPYIFSPREQMQFAILWFTLILRASEDYMRQ